MQDKNNTQQQQSEHPSLSDIIAITTAMNRNAGIKGRCAYGHVGTFGARCVACSDYFTRDLSDDASDGEDSMEEVP